jgi:hypothetical protein
MILLSNTALARERWNSRASKRLRGRTGLFAGVTVVAPSRERGLKRLSDAELELRAPRVAAPLAGTRIETESPPEGGTPNGWAAVAGEIEADGVILYHWKFSLQPSPELSDHKN